MKILGAGDSLTRERLNNLDVFVITESLALWGLQRWPCNRRYQVYTPKLQNNSLSLKELNGGGLCVIHRSSTSVSLNVSPGVCIFWAHGLGHPIFKLMPPQLGITLEFNFSHFDRVFENQVKSLIKLLPSKSCSSGPLQLGLLRLESMSCYLLLLHNKSLSLSWCGSPLLQNCSNCSSIKEAESGLQCPQ